MDSSEAKLPVLILGCGKVGRRVGCALVERGGTVYGLVRSPEKGEALRADGLVPLIVDLDSPDPIPSVLPCGPLRILYSIPPAAQGTSDQRARRFCRELLPELDAKSVLYLGTTGVYGDCQGDWVDETRPAAPANDRSKRRLDAERCLLAACGDRSIPLSSLRISGIYGPDRLPLERLNQGMPVPPDEESAYVNLIHEDDLIALCLAALESPHRFDIVNACDGSPLPMSLYFREIARHYELPLPQVYPLEELKARLSPAMFSYFCESKRLRNDRLLKLLGTALSFPDFCGWLRTQPPAR